MYLYLAIMEVVLYVLYLSPIPQLQHDKLCSILANKSQDKTYFGYHYSYDCVQLCYMYMYYNSIKLIRITNKVLYFYLFFLLIRICCFFKTKFVKIEEIGTL